MPGKPVTKAKKTASTKPKAEKKTRLSKKKKRVSDTTAELQHFLVPVHIKVSDKEKEELLKKYNVTIKELPKIYADDPAIRHLEAKENDIIKIIRKSPTAGEAVFYRGVINE